MFSNCSFVLSHLLQMRGLKLLEPADAKSAPLVASFTDAWIETELRRLPCKTAGVASFTDAWIETKARIMKARKREVASFTDAWIETLFEQCAQQLYRVASFTDAWIETGLNESKRLRYMSHLLQMRGLKHENHETSCKTLRILFLTKIQHLTKLFSLIGNDLETSEVLIFATSCINQKNALSEYKDTISFLNLSIICSKIREIILFEKCNS